MIAEVVRHEADFRSGEQVHVWWHPQDELDGLRIMVSGLRRPFLAPGLP